MLPNDMDLLIQERQSKAIKKQKNQLPYAAAVIISAIILCLFLWKSNHKYITYWIIGIGIGIVLRYSRFCFSGAIRDIFLLGNNKLFKGLLLALMISTVGFGAVQYRYLQNNPMNYAYIPGAITSAGIHIAIGAFMFGIGMTIAGGCASGTLMRIGEGHALHLVVLVGFIIGSVWGAKDYGFWYDKIISKTKVIYFPKYVDLRIVIVLQLIVLIMMYKAADRYERK